MPGASASKITHLLLAWGQGDAGALDRLEGFASLAGPAFYRLPPNEARLTLRRSPEPLAIPAEVATGAGPAVYGLFDRDELVGRPEISIILQVAIRADLGGGHPTLPSR